MYEPKYNPGDIVQVVSVIGRVPIGEVQMAYWHQSSKIIGEHGHQRYVIVVDGICHDVCEIELQTAQQGVELGDCRCGNKAHAYGACLACLRKSLLGW